MYNKANNSLGQYSQRGLDGGKGVVVVRAVKALILQNKKAKHLPPPDEQHGRPLLLWRQKQNKKTLLGPVYDPHNILRAMAFLFLIPPSTSKQKHS